jgi:hypothetical protein
MNDERIPMPAGGRNQRMVNMECVKPILSGFQKSILLMAGNGCSENADNPAHNSFFLFYGTKQNKENQTILAIDEELTYF